MNRRQFLRVFSVLSLGATGLGTATYWPEQGLANQCLGNLPDALVRHPLMQAIWDGIDPAQVWDCHAHIIGAGESGSGAWFNPQMDSAWHPVLSIQKQFYMNGGCIVEGHEDESFVARMAALSAQMPAGYKSMLFAFDWLHDEQGQADQQHSIFHIPNHYAAQIAKQYPQYFEWVASIHPYRADALDALDVAHAKGARAIKWLPSGMNINPASPKCARFYQKLHDFDLPIISHTGRESAVQGGDQRYGNPLHMRHALDAGVRVVLAHCASDGEDEDLDNSGKSVKSFDLFSRLMDTPGYQTLAFGEISAMTLFNHAWALEPVLARADWHQRLLNGTDYPLPAILPLISTEQLVRKGLLQQEHLPFLQDLHQYNALLFDFALKRLLRVEGRSFPASVFQTRGFFERTTS